MYLLYIMEGKLDDIWLLIFTCWLAEVSDFMKAALIYICNGIEWVVYSIVKT